MEEHKHSVHNTPQFTHSSVNGRFVLLLQTAAVHRLVFVSLRWVYTSLALLVQIAVRSDAANFYLLQRYPSVPMAFHPCSQLSLLGRTEKECRAMRVRATPQTGNWSPLKKRTSACGINSKLLTVAHMALPYLASSYPASLSRLTSFQVAFFL